MNTKPNKTSFKKGNPGGGRKPLPKEIRELSAKTKPAIIAAYWKLSNMNLTQIEALDPGKMTMIEAIIARCLVRAYKSGQTGELSRIWAECHGKPKESVELEIPNIPVSITINGITPNTDPSDSH